jgi:hypothetical protein
MNVHRQTNRLWLRYPIAGIILVICSSCSPSEKIIGLWKTTFNCTSKQGVNVAYSGVTAFLANSIAQDRGGVTISSTDAQGNITKIGARVKSTSNWYIENNKLTRAAYSSNFTISTVDRNLENLYSERDTYSFPVTAFYPASSYCDRSYTTGDSNNQKFCYERQDNGNSAKQKAENNRIQSRQTIATEANSELEREAKKYNSQETDIVKLDGTEMSIKQRNGSALYDFHYTAVCEKQDFKRLTQEEIRQDPSLNISNSN